MFTAAVFVLICLPGFPFILLTFTKFSFYSRLLYFHPGWNIFNLCRNFSCTGNCIFFFNSVYRVKTSTWNENLDIISSLVWVHGLWRTYLQYHRWVLCIEQSNFLVGTSNFSVQYSLAHDWRTIHNIIQLSALQMDWSILLCTCIHIYGRLELRYNQMLTP